MSTPHAFVACPAPECQSATISAPTRNPWKEAIDSQLGQVENDRAVILLPQEMREGAR